MLAIQFARFHFIRSRRGTEPDIKVSAPPNACRSDSDGLDDHLAEVSVMEWDKPDYLMTLR